jgi:hypothetical protein
MTGEMGIPNFCIVAPPLGIRGDGEGVLLDQRQVRPPRRARKRTPTSRSTYAAPDLPPPQKTASSGLPQQGRTTPLPSPLDRLTPRPQPLRRLRLRSDVCRRRAIAAVLHVGSAPSALPAREQHTPCSSHFTAAPP